MRVVYIDLFICTPIGCSGSGPDVQALTDGVAAG